MKVAIHVDGPIIRGNERQVIAIAEGLRSRGHHVVVSCRSGGPVAAELARLGVPTTGIRPRGDADLWNALRFAAWLRNERPDAVLLTSWKRAFVGLAAARLAGVRRTVIRIGAQQPLDGPLRGLEERYALRNLSDGIVVNNRMMLRTLTHAIPRLDRSKLYYVPNGIRPRSATAPDLRVQLGVPAGSVLVAAVGGLEQNKGFDLLIDAVARLPSDTHAILIGGGSDPRRMALERVAAEAGVEARVHLLGQRADVAGLLAAADVFVLSSRLEGMSVAMLEAMAAGLPVVAFEIGGAVDALAPRDGRPPAGWLVPPEDVGALAETLRGVVRDVRSGAPRIEQQVREASWRIRNWFDADRMLDGYEAALKGGDPPQSGHDQR